jgi:hypothetical protein
MNEINPLKKRPDRPRAWSRPTKTGVVLGLALSCATLIATPAQAIPTMTGGEIIARAESAIGSAYTWGRESWIPNVGGTGPDCSGYALKCWEVPRTLLYQEEADVNASFSPRYTSYDFFNCTGPWSALSSRSLLEEGDVLVKNNGSSGHVVIYAGGDAWNCPIIYEAPGTGLTVRRTSRYLGSEYQPRRRSDKYDTKLLIVDNPTARSTRGGDVGENWKRCTYVSGYYGDNYQYHEPTTASAWTCWTPRFTTSGYYDVYARWTGGGDRASNVPVVIFTASGRVRKYIDQRVNGGTWYLLGRYYFGVGYSPTMGSVAFYATGANGYVISDAVVFAPVQ